MESENDILESKILIIDDDLSSIKLLVHYLHTAGYSNVRFLTDSRDAVEEYERFEPDLLILDLMMPHVDGFRVFKKIRELSPESHNVLILSALNDYEAKIMALESGAKHVLAKPITRDEVIACVNRLLGAQPGGDQPEK